MAAVVFSSEIVFCTYKPTAEDVAIPNVYHLQMCFFKNIAFEWQDKENGSHKRVYSFMM